MSTVSSNSTAPTEVPFFDRVPPLQSGDRLTRDEFERRYRATPRKIKAELVEGIVYVMGPPVSAEGHSRPHSRFITWLGTYEAYTPGVAVGDNGTVRLDAENEPQPDASLRILPKHGGQSRTSHDDYIEGAPELVAEIAASSVSYDLNEKLEAYRRNSVREYIVWRVWDRAIDWFKLHEGQFVRQAPDEGGVYRSSVFPGLWLSGGALLTGDQAGVLAILQQGLASPEHQQFVERLAQQARVQ
ncbi:Uma2 family endonuclease [Anatilimnocola sp. NA78]|uniref:Uma2 family endonuclease n=1 Tax=Anatilimnocola sp. NA78 TaxID=3415683 RepID=UPI003CE5BDEB